MNPATLLLLSCIGVVTDPELDLCICIGALFNNIKFIRQYCYTPTLI
jgi:hypothetical protein